MLMTFKQMTLTLMTFQKWL